MNLIRLIAIAVLFWLLYRMILRLLSRAKRPAARQQQQQKSETMVRCEQCGVHIPKSQAVERGNKFYCCEEHRDAADSWKRDE